MKTAVQTEPFRGNEATAKELEMKTAAQTEQFAGENRSQKETEMNKMLKHGTNRPTRLVLVLAALAVVTFAAGTARATVLTFNIDKASDGTPAANNALMSTYPGYGDNVTSTSVTSGAFVYNYAEGNGFTPTITVDFGHGGAPALGTYGYGGLDSAVSPMWNDVNFLLDQSGAGGTFYYTFTPTGDEQIRVNSFDVFGFNQNLSHEMTWALRQGSTAGPVLFSGGTSGPTVMSHGSPFTVGTGSGGISGVVVLEVQHVSGSGGAFGLDNLNFDVVTSDPAAIPEPATMMLLGSGLVGVLLRRRRE